VRVARISVLAVLIAVLAGSACSSSRPVAHRATTTITTAPTTDVIIERCGPDSSVTFTAVNHETAAARYRFTLVFSDARNRVVRRAAVHTDLIAPGISDEEYVSYKTLFAPGPAPRVARCAVEDVVRSAHP